LPDGIAIDFVPFVETFILLVQSSKQAFLAFLAKCPISKRLILFRLKISLLLLSV